MNPVQHRMAPGTIRGLIRAGVDRVWGRSAARLDAFFEPFARCPDLADVVRATRYSARRFIGARDVEMTLRGVTILAGDCGTGKSTILRGLDALHAQALPSDTYLSTCFELDALTSAGDKLYVTLKAGEPARVENRAGAALPGRAEACARILGPLGDRGEVRAAAVRALRKKGTGYDDVARRLWRGGITHCRDVDEDGTDAILCGLYGSRRPLATASDGERAFFALIAQCLLAENCASVAWFDDPETHLSERLRAIATTAIQNAASSTPVIVATRSTGLIDALKGDVYVLDVPRALLEITPLFAGVRVINVSTGAVATVLQIGYKMVQVRYDRTGEVRWDFSSNFESVETARTGRA